VAPFLRVTGQSGSEVTGVAFSPAYDRLFFSSQRGTDGRGLTYEVTGPFRRPARRRISEPRSALTSG
jgi:secreted PhoX family phosphatase